MNSGKGTLRLVYSRDKLIEKNNAKVLTNWDQLELFPYQSKQDLLIFVYPNESSFYNILYQVRRGIIRHILDLRTMPNLTIGAFTRAFFLKELNSYSVHYMNLYSFVNKVENTSGNLNVLADQGGSLLSYIEKSLTNGPTVIFTDYEPETDFLAVSLSKVLREANVPVSIAYASA